PLAPSATARASWTRTRFPPSASRRAAAMPVTPAPTTATSTVPACRGEARGIGSSSSQYGFTGSIFAAEHSSLHAVDARVRGNRTGELELDERLRDLGRRAAGLAHELVGGRRQQVE